jgi:hypothetical protein
MPSMRIPVALVLVGVSSTVAAADAKQNKAFVTAMAKSPDAAKPLVGFPLATSELQFATDDCQSKFPTGAKIDEADFAAFVECVKPLHLAADGDAIIADPGFAIQTVFSKGKLVVLYGGSTFRPERAEKNLAATVKVNPDAEAKAAVARKKVPFLAVDIALCIRRDGSVESAHVERYNVVDAGDWAEQLLGLTTAATFKPFTIGNHALRVCTHQRHVYPTAKRKAGLAELARLEDEAMAGVEGGEVGGEVDGVEGGVEGGVVGGDAVGVIGAPPPPPPPPPPPAPPHIVPPLLLEGNRIAGNKVIIPDDATKTKIADAHRDKIVGSFRLCVDVRGEVASITMLKSTGFSAYDQLIQTQMRLWKYTPYQVNGKAVPVCTAITFIYSQK